MHPVALWVSVLLGLFIGLAALSQTAGFLLRVMETT